MLKKEYLYIEILLRHYRKLLLCSTPTNFSVPFQATLIFLSLNKNISCFTNLQWNKTKASVCENGQSQK